MPSPSRKQSSLSQIPRNSSTDRAEGFQQQDVPSSLLDWELTMTQPRESTFPEAAVWSQPELFPSPFTGSLVDQPLKLGSSPALGCKTTRRGPLSAAYLETQHCLPWFGAEIKTQLQKTYGTFLPVFIPQIALFAIGKL